MEVGGCGGGVGGEEATEGVDWVGGVGEDFEVGGCCCC